MRRETN